MEISFGNSQLDRLCSSPSKAFKKLGKDNANKLFQRLSELQSAVALSDLLPPFPGHYHLLGGELQNKWACSLVGLDRLIFEATDKSQIDARQITAVTLLEIGNYHKYGN